jgi:hypothetical protein
MLSTTTCRGQGGGRTSVMLSWPWLKAKRGRGSGTLPRRSYPLLALPRPAQLCRAVCGAVVRGTAPLKNSSGPDECPAKTPVAIGPVPIWARVRCQSLPFFVNVSPACRGTAIRHMLIKRYWTSFQKPPRSDRGDAQLPPYITKSCRPPWVCPVTPECLISSPSVD